MYVTALSNANCVHLHPCETLNVCISDVKTDLQTVSQFWFCQKCKHYQMFCTHGMLNIGLINCLFSCTRPDQRHIRGPLKAKAFSENS